MHRWCGVIVRCRIKSLAQRARSTSSARATYDFVVVGGGAAGAVIASRVSEDPAVKVLLLEAGPKPPPESSIPAACGSLQHSAVDWARRGPGGGVGQKLKDGLMNLPGGKMLGGSTSINYMAYVRGDPRDYDSWLARGATGWSWADVLPYFKRSEGFHAETAPGEAAVDADAHGRAGPYAVSFRSPQLPDVSAFVKAAVQQGYVVADYNSIARADMNSEGRGVVSPHQFTIQSNGRRESTFTAFLEPHMGKRSNLHVATHAHAQRILFEGQRAVGVEYLENTGMEEIKQVFARHEIVISCGSYESPGLLLRSGVGPEQELQDAGIDCKLNLPGVGKNLKDHLYLCVPVAGLGVTRSQLEAECGIADDKSLYDAYLKSGNGLAATSLYEASAFFSSGLKPSKPDAQDGQISFCTTTSLPSLWNLNFGISDFTADNWNLEAMFSSSKPAGMILPTLNQPESTGEVRLAGRDLHVRHNYLSEEADVRMYVAICKEAMRLLDQQALSNGARKVEVLIPKVLESRFGTDLQNDALWEAWIRSYANTIYHPVSSCAMNSVVDAQCRVLDLDGLRVADASIMPEAISGNTQAACVMIGEKVADMIANQHGLHLSCTS